jgi:hypothetical protein
MTGVSTGAFSVRACHPRPLVSILIALFTLVIQLLAFTPGAQSAPGWMRVRSMADASASSMPSARGAEGATSVAAARDDDASIREVEPRVSVVWVRAAQQVASILAARPATLLYGSAADAVARLSAEATFAASVRVRTLDASHAICARGALLPYFPTAPPLQG